MIKIEINAKIENGILSTPSGTVAGIVFSKTGFIRIKRLGPKRKRKKQS